VPRIAQLNDRNRAAELLNVGLAGFPDAEKLKLALDEVRAKQSGVSRMHSQI